MSVARRPLLTATVAGTVLCALWFVPSANATAERYGAERQRTSAGTTGTTGAAGTAADGLALASTGSLDTTPYLIGGAGFLAVGVGSVMYAVRRRAAFH